jgi:hypothetical protein
MINFIYIMVVFLINEIELSLKNSNTILDVKKEIIKQFNLTTKYIDIFFIMDKPMRILGKFNVEPGKLPRTFDRYELEKFAFKDKVSINYETVDGYDPDKKRAPIISGGGSKYIPPSRGKSSFDHNALEQDIHTEPTFDLNSKDDFPSL